MSVFVSLTHQVHRVCVKTAGLSVFSVLQSLFVSQLSSTSDDTLTWMILCKTWSLSFCLCMSPRSDRKKAGTCPVSDTCRTQTDSPSCFSLLCSLHNPPGGKAFRVFAVIWVPQRAASPNKKAHLGCWIGSNQALLSNPMTEMFLALLHFRG